MFFALVSSSASGHPNLKRKVVSKWANVLRNMWVTVVNNSNTLPPQEVPDHGTSNQETTTSFVEGYWTRTMGSFAFQRCKDVLW